MLVRILGIRRLSWFRGWFATGLMALGVSCSMPAMAGGQNGTFCVLGPNLAPVQICQQFPGGTRVPVPTPAFAYVQLGGSTAALSATSTGLEWWGGPYDNPAAVAHTVASANARIGVVTVGTNHDTLDANDNPASLALAGWTDPVTIDAPGKSGQAGTWNGALVLAGLLGHAENFGAPAGELALVLPGASISSPLGPCPPFGEGGAPSNVPGCLAVTTSPPNDMGFAGSVLLHFALPFTYGSPFNLSPTLLSYSVVTGGNGISQHIETNATLAWGGTTSVLDATGQALSRYSLHSASGFDYVSAMPVPEPATGLSLGLGLVALLLARRRLGYPPPAVDAPIDGL